MSLQEITDKEDLLLLIKGDDVEFDFMNYKGLARFIHEDEGKFYFVRKSHEDILVYYLKLRDLGVSMNKIFKKDGIPPVPISINKTLPQYEIYNKLLGETK